jgi:hypothetical protein
MSLSSLIVQREIASIREVEEALARQVLYGGDLLTNLLEVARLDEAVLLPIVAESLGLPAAPSGELPRPEPDAHRLVAAEVAVERNLAPLSVDRYGLTVAVAEPLSAEVEQELAFALALPISQRIAPLVRIKQALARDYGVPIDRRLQRLLMRMSTDGPRAGSSFPPMRDADFRLGAPRPPSIAPAAPPPSEIAIVRPSVPPGGGAGTLVRHAVAPSMRPLRRRRGAITVETARAELEEADERDTIFDLLFEFARQYFDYTAVFIVHGEVAEGRDAFGDGAPRDKVARIGVPLDLPSILASSREKKAVLQRVPSLDGLDAVLMNDLARSGKTLCVVLPVIVRTRVVALLLGDGGDTGIDATTLADVEGIVGAATAAFERLIVRRKLKGSVQPPADGAAEAAAPVAVPGEPQFSVVPATKVSELSDRPAAEELAPPIRDLLTEPISRIGETVREPVVQTFLPADDAAAPLVGFRRPSENVPPPANVLAVRKPSGRPIPREEPDSYPRMPAVTAMSNLGDAAQEAIQRVSGTPGTPPASISPRSSSRRRGEAPKLDFGALPPPSSMFGSEAPGANEVERRLLAEIHGRGVESEPLTSRDSRPPVVSPSYVPAPVSSDPEPPHSPKAESPMPQRVATFRPPITDTSPVSLQGDFSEAPAALEPPASSEMVSAEDSDVDVVDLVPSPRSPKRDSAPPTPWPSAMDVAVIPSQRLPPIPESSSRPMPASEQQVSVALHRPPSSRSDHTRILPSVIVDVASEYVGLVERVIAGTTPGSSEGQSADEAETELLRAGGYAMPAIMARFPGPVTVELLPDGPLPRVAECGPVLRLVASQRRTALPFVLSHVEDSDVEKRFWATYLLTELLYPDVLDPIVQRVFDDEPRVRRAARAAARAFAEGHPGAIVERLELIAMDGGEALERRVLAVEALGEMREALAVPALIPLLDDPSTQIVAAVRAALVSIARQDFGASSAKWQAWWEPNKDRHRLEWLIDALMHEQAALRAAAGEELKTITKEYFGYYDDLPKRERERAQTRYREWWNTVGRVRFSRSASPRG